MDVNEWFAEQCGVSKAGSYYWMEDASGTFEFDIKDPRCMQVVRQHLLDNDWEFHYSKEGCGAMDAELTQAYFAPTDYDCCVAIYEDLK